MERINEHNYEAFFLDHLEGNLNAQQEFELMDFLDKHPDLKAELDMDLSELQLQAAPVGLDTSFLKKGGIEPNAVDDLMIASVEGELSVQQDAELSTYVRENGLEKSFNYYKNTVLFPDTSENYGDKTDLKKKDRVFIPWGYRIAAGVIGLGLLIGIPLYNATVDETIVQNDIQPKSVQTENELNTAFEFPLVQPMLTTENVANEDQEQVQEQHSIEQNASYHQSEGGIVKSEKLTEEDGAVDESGIVTKAKVLDNPLPTVDDKESIDKENEGGVKEVEQDSKDNDDPGKNSKPVDDNQNNPLLEPEKVKEHIKSRQEYEEETIIDANVFKQEVSWKRQKNTESGEVKSHKIKLGKFEFERKKQ